MKPIVYKKAKDAVRVSRHIVGISESLSANGEGFMPVIDGKLMDNERGVHAAWLPSVDHKNERLSLVPYAA